jgi:hypothetical protein
MSSSFIHLFSDLSSRLKIHSLLRFVLLRKWSLREELITYFLLIDTDRIEI